MESIRCHHCKAVIAAIYPTAIVRTFTVKCPHCGAQRTVKAPDLDVTEKQVYTKLVPV